jgi:hypothetical protein
MDEFDRASELEERQRVDALARSRAGNCLTPTGDCHFCGELVKRLFCDTDCRDAYERVQRARKRNGRPQ